MPIKRICDRDIYIYMINICVYMHSHIHVLVCCSWSPRGLQKARFSHCRCDWPWNWKGCCKTEPQKNGLCAAKTRTMRSLKQTANMSEKCCLGDCLLPFPFGFRPCFRGDYFSGSSLNKHSRSSFRPIAPFQGEKVERRVKLRLCSHPPFFGILISLCQGLYCWSNWHEP